MKYDRTKVWNGEATIWFRSHPSNPWQSLATWKGPEQMKKLIEKHPGMEFRMSPIQPQAVEPVLEEM